MDSLEEMVVGFIVVVTITLAGLVAIVELSKALYQSLGF